MTYFAVKELGIPFNEALFNESASRLMLLLNQHSLCNIGDDKMMTLSDLEIAEERKKLKNG